MTTQDIGVETTQGVGANSHASPPAYVAKNIGQMIFVPFKHEDVYDILAKHPLSTNVGVSVW